MSLIKKFETTTSRVKGISFHPNRPWVLTSLHSGAILLWDINMNIVLAKFDQAEGPVRCVNFHPQMPLFVSGADNGNIRVWNYKQKRCIFTLKGHIDYIRTTFFHHQLPWILSASDDQTMRIWNYQSRNCINIITGHSHYVMCAQFHNEKNYIVSASLDSTVRIWDFTVLRKKLTENKNIQGFVGIQIECIKVLEGHEKGCNWASFHPTSNIIASGSDDRKIKLWKYTNEVAWEHSTILGHKNNVSCLLFDDLTDNLISNSQDKTLRIWNIQSKSQIIEEKQKKSRYWMLAKNKNSSLLAAGHDQGLQIFQIHQQRIPHVLISKQLVAFAQNFKTFLYDVKTKQEKMDLYQYKQKTPNTMAYIDRLIENPHERSQYMAQVKEGAAVENFYMLKKKQSYLNYPTLSKQFHALDACFVNKDSVALLMTPKSIGIQTGSLNTARIISYKTEEFCISRIFSSNLPDQMVIVTSHNKMIRKLNTQTKAYIGKCEIDDPQVKNIVWGNQNIAILSKNSIVVANKDNFQRITIIREKFPIKSAFWENEKLLFYTTINHLKYAFMNGETGVLQTLVEPFHILQKLNDNKFLAFNKKNKVFEVKFPDYSQIQLKMAISQRKIDEIKKILSKVGDSKKKITIKHLVEKGFADLALTLVINIEQKFPLAIQASNFELAFEICNTVNTKEYWKMLGDEALKQGIFEAFEVSCQKLKNFDQLNFLYSLQHNEQKLQKMLKIAKKTNNLILSFNSSMYLRKGEVFQQILMEAGLDSLANLSNEAYNQQGQKSELLKRLKSRPLTPMTPVGEDNFANWPHNEIQIEEEE